MPNSLEFIKASDINFTENRLFVYDNNKKRKSVQFAYGSILSKHLIGKGKKVNGEKAESQYDFYYKIDDQGEISQVVAKPKTTVNCKNNSFCVQLFPSYAKDIEFSDRSNKGNVLNLVIRAANEPSDIALTNAILSLLHYRNTTTKGCRWLLEFKSDQDKSNFYNWPQNKKKNNEKFKTIDNVDAYAKSFEKHTNIISCLIVDRMNHGVPKGRQQIVEENGLEIDSLRNLSVLWISRIATLPAYEKHGFAGLLSAHFAEYGHQYLLPIAEYIEVIVTEPKENAKKIKDGTESHFLLKAGYELDKQLLPAKSMKDCNGKTILCNRLYFYKKVGKE